jgi:hypothetical protein
MLSSLRRRMRVQALRLAACLSLILLAFSVSSAEVYRYVDSEGNVVYSDRPQNNGAEVVELNVVTPRPANVAPTSAGPPTPATDEEAAGEDPSEDEAAAAVAAQREEDRARNCEIARERNERYQTARRLYRELPDGEREYLDDDEIDAAKARALTDVDEWCN